VSFFDNPIKVISSLVAPAIAAMLLVSAVGCVPEGEVGIKRSMGAAVATVTPGAYVKVPLTQDVVTMSTRSELVKWDKMMAYSKDQQPTDLTLSVLVALDPSYALPIYIQYGTDALARVVKPGVERAVKDVFGKYNAINAVQNRAQLGADLFKAVQEEVQVSGIKVQEVNLQNIDFSDAYEKSVEARMLAEVEVAKLQQNRQREIVQNEINVNAAKAKADAMRAAADAEAYATKQKGDAEAHAIKVRTEALSANPSLIELTKAERWNGVLPTTMVPGQSTTFMAVK
jgi:regulator of protease activity HflC (stomatin/prohibitin superfamily)